MTELSYNDCQFCPRNCGIDRAKGLGYCKAPYGIMAAKAMLHEGEEPCLIGPPPSKDTPRHGDSGRLTARHGAGAIFFSHCNLRCVFCQNYEISLEGMGKTITEERLEEIILGFQEQGAACIDLVTPTPYLASLVPVLQRVKPKLSIPVVYNCGGYESVDALRHLEGLIDIYMPDLKYYSPELSLRYSGAADYFEQASKALEEMFRQVGPVGMEGDQMKKGLLIRHLVLPGAYHDSEALMDYLGKIYREGEIYISLLSQYTPFGKVEEGAYPQINRRVTTYEYEKVVDRALENHLAGFRQNRNSATMEMRPNFDLKGL